MPELIYRPISERNDVLLDLAADLKRAGYVVTDSSSPLIVEWKWEIDGQSFRTLDACGNLAIRQGRQLEWAEGLHRLSELCFCLTAVEQ